METYKYRIVKYQHCGQWKFAIQKDHWLYGWKYVTQFGNGDVYTGSVTGAFSKIKLFDTEKEAEETIDNLLYKKTIYKT